MAISNGESGSSVRTKLNAHMGEFLHGSDYGLVDSASDQTTALQAAFAAASAAQKTLILAGGTYYYTGPLEMAAYPNLHIQGCGGTSFTTRLVANGTSGLNYDGGVAGSEDFVFHGSITDVVLQHLGTAGSYMLRLQQAYSMRFRNIRFVRDTAPCSSVIELDESNNDILFENTVAQVQGASRVPVGVLAKKNCGTIRFNKLDMEGCERNVKWQGGKLEFYTPYFESAGVNGFDLALDAADDTAYLNVFGGECGSATDAVGIAIRDECHDVNFYGTHISGSTANDIYVYGIANARHINFWGCLIDQTKINGDTTDLWKAVAIHGNRLVGSKTHDWGSLATLVSETTTVTVTGAKLGGHTARAWMNITTAGVMLFAWVSANDTVSVIAFNATGSTVDLASGPLYVVVDAAPDR